MARFRRLIGLTAFGATTAIGAIAPATAASAAPVTIDATISETIPVTTGALTAGAIPGCAAPVVHTENATASTSGSTTIFRADKRFDCGGGDEFTLRLVAAVSGCATFDVGAWRAVGGTGSFAGVRGRGILIGSYTDGGAPADACSADGIDDRYIGSLRI